MKTHVRSALGAAVFLAAASARADELNVRTLEYGGWPDAVAALESDVAATGRVVHVVVRDEGGRSLRCEQYQLTLDEVSQRAFRLGACDSANGATDVMLMDRSALFEHGDLVPRPLPAGISAVQIRRGGSRGGAGSVAGSELSCSVSVRPYVMDLEHGVPVYLEPGRFVLRTLATGVDVIGQHDAWTLRAPRGAALWVNYEVYDRERNEVVLRDAAELSCAHAEPAAQSRERSRASDAIPPRQASASSVASALETNRTVVDRVGQTCEDAPTLRDGALAVGSTRNGSVVPLYVVDLAGPAGLVLDLDAGFGGQVSIFRGCPGERERADDLMVFGATRDDGLRWDLPPGRYYVRIIDADIHDHDGRYAMGVRLQPGYSGF